ncbi:MAG: hypothetical protein R2817_01650 [Flavobacteriales bacterium]
MWPVQTLTLLLCLTDEEQLFAQRTVEPIPPPGIEWVMPQEEETQNAIEEEAPAA